MAELENRKHERFCHEYIIDYNGTQAAIRAGYKATSARTQASDLIANPDILARVRELQEEQMKRLALNADMVTLEILKTYQRCSELTPALQRNEKTGKYEEVGVYQFDSRGALRALELLGKRFGMFDKPLGKPDNEKNNLLDQLLNSTGKDLDTDDLPEVQ